MQKNRLYPQAFKRRELQVDHAVKNAEIVRAVVDFIIAPDAGDGGGVDDGGAAQMIVGDRQMVASVTVCGVIDSYTWQGKTMRLL